MPCQRRAEKQRHRAVVLRQPAQLLAFRHGCAPFGTGQDHRLRQFRHRQLRTQCRCRSEDGADTRDDLIADSAQLQQRHLFKDRPVHGGITGVHTGDAFPGPDSLHHQLHLPLQVHARALQHLSPFLSAMNQRFAYQGIRVEHKIRRTQNPAAFDGNQLRVAGSGTDNVYFWLQQQFCHLLTTIRLKYSSSVPRSLRASRHTVSYGEVTLVTTEALPPRPNSSRTSSTVSNTFATLRKTMVS